MTQRPARPTVRCLLEDLAASWPADDVGHRLREGRLPPPCDPLDGLRHPLLDQARTQFDPSVDHPTERVAELDDRVWLKVKDNGDRWRGAVHVIDGRPWIGAAGWREDGARSDVYAELGRAARNKAKGQHGRSTDTTWLLPTEHDMARLRLERAHHVERVQPVLDLQGALRDAIQHAGEWASGQVAGGQVRARVEREDDGSLSLELDPTPSQGFILAMVALGLSPLESGDWDLEEVAPDGRLTYFTIMDPGDLLSVLSWSP